MLHVINFFSIISIIGSGYLFTRILFAKQTQPVSLLFRIAISFSLGLLANLTINLISQSLKIGILFSSILGAIGILLLMFDALQTKPFAKPSLSALVKNGALVGLLVLAYFRVTFQALGTSDMLLIWASQAKMIYEFGGLTTTINWAELGAWHTDYPKLFQVTSAQLMYLVGYWNPYTAKMAMFTLIFGGLLWLFAFYRPAISFAFLVLLVVFFIPGEILWSGPMDGIFALWATVATLCAIHYSKSRDLYLLYGAIVAISVCTNLKNEGFLLGLCIMLALSIALSISKTRQQVFTSIIQHKFQVLEVGLFSALPIGLWSIYKNALALSNDLKLGEVDLINRFLQRWNDPAAVNLINTYLFLLSGPFIHLLAGCISLFLLTFFLRRYISLSAIICFVIAILYMIGILVIYYTTPNDLLWHLNTSADRVMFTALCLFGLTIFELLQEFENPSLS
ncbi:MAG: hypothetical protein KIH69_009115 [Anaerolineae bacterium]|nr:hypothetical protein [Anaerolineae bacterium]